MRASGTSSGRDKAPKRFWFDPRFAIGLGLIVASVIGVVGIVGAADTSVQVLSARTSLTPGERVDASDLMVTSVRLENAGSLYLKADGVPDAGLVVTKSVAAGELVPVSAVGVMLGVRQTSLVVSVNGQLAAAVVPGASVDLWASKETENGIYGPPIVIVSGATVVRLVESDGLVVDNTAGSVELLIERSKIARVLEAIANGDALSLVPVNLPLSD